MHVLRECIIKVIDVVYENAGNKTIWVFPKNGFCYRHYGECNPGTIPELQQSSTVLLYDAYKGKRSSVPFRLKVLVFTSNRSEYSAFLDRYIKLGFPTPNINECFIMGKLFKVSQDEVSRKFDKYNGNLRFLFCYNERDADGAVSRAIDSFVPDNITDIIDCTFIGHDWQQAPSCLFSTHLNMHLFATSDDKSDVIKVLLNAYLATNVIWSIASDHISGLLYSKDPDWLRRSLERYASVTAMSALFSYFVAE